MSELEILKEQERLLGVEGRVAAESAGVSGRMVSSGLDPARIGRLRKERCTVAKIQSLTTEQANALVPYRDKWLKIGLFTAPVDVAAAHEWGRWLMRDFLKRSERPLVVVMSSPLAAWYAVCLLSVREQVRDQVLAQVSGQVREQVRRQVSGPVRDQVGAQVGAQVWEQVVGQVRRQVWEQVEDQVWRQVRDQVGAQVGAQVWEQVVAQVSEQVRGQVRAQVWEQVEEQVSGQVREQVRDLQWPHMDGQAWSGWAAFYDYMATCLHVPLNCPAFSRMIEVTRYGPVWPLSTVCVISDTPREINMDDGRLHKSGGPSLRYADDFKVWSLHGVRVPQWVAETPAEDMEPAHILAIENVDVRREAIRRAGVERVFDHVPGETLDTSGNYTLRVINLGGGERTYLKMLNPSIQAWHVEAVARECRTVQDALNYRNGLDPDMVDDENGADWFQHGDVIIRPKGAKKFKSQPTKLA